MSTPQKRSPAGDDLDVSSNRKIGEVAQLFRSSIKSGAPVRIEDLVESAEGRVEFKRRLIVELVLLERDQRMERGESPTLSDYQQRFPTVTQELQQAWEAAQHSDPVFISTISHSMESSDVSLPRQDPSEHSTREGELQLIGRYKLEAVLGQGGFGTVWRAFDQELQRHVAIKVLRNDRVFPTRVIEAFIDESRKLAQLQHPAIVTVYDFGREQGQLYLVSELAEGGTLIDWTRQHRVDGGPPRYADVAAIVATIADGLHYAHLKGLVHRDVKPGNILIGQNGQPRLADFGLAISEEEQLRELAATLGTYAYMSPEQIRGESHLVDPRSDIYSLGTVLYELLTGRRPFIGNSAEQYREQILFREVRPPRTILDTIPPELERIVLKCLAKPLRERYTTAADLAADLRATFSAQPAETTQSIPRDHLTRNALLAAVGVAALLVGLLLLKPSGQRQQPITRPDELNQVAASDKQPVLESRQATDPRPSGTGTIDATSAPDVHQLPILSQPTNDWVKLLTREPVLLTHPRIPGDSRLEPRLKAGELFVLAYQNYVVQLGETTARDFAWRMRVSQSRWSPFGVFLGGHADEKKPDHLRFWKIHFGEPAVALNASISKRTIPIRCDAVLINQFGTELDAVQYPIGEGELPGMNEESIEIVVADGRLQSLQWGQAIFSTFPQELQDVEGMLGICLDRSSATFKQAYFKVQPPTSK